MEMNGMSEWIAGLSDGEYFGFGLMLAAFVFCIIAYEVERRTRG